MYKRVEEYRANKVLFNFIKSNNINGTVLLPVNICPDVVATLKCTGLELLYADISPLTFCIDEEAALSLIDQVQVFLFVRTYGVEGDFNPFFKRLKKKNPKLVIIDDCCLCLPHQINSGVADLVLFSIGEKKVVNLGQGGFGYYRKDWEYFNVTDESGLLLDISFFIDKSRFDETKAMSIKHRDHLYRIYQQQLPLEIQFPPDYQLWRFNIIVDNKERILQAIFSEGLFASGHYKPIEEGYVHANWLYNHVINLFEDSYFTEEQANKTCAVINGLLR